MARKIIADLGVATQDVFETSSKDLVIGLIALGHQPILVESEGKLTYYKFNRIAVDPDVTKLLTGQEVLIPYRGVIAANSVWAMNLTRANELAVRA